jgi:hypothetical protein
MYRRLKQLERGHIPIENVKVVDSLIGDHLSETQEVPRPQSGRWFLRRFVDQYVAGWRM